MYSNRHILQITIIRMNRICRPKNENITQIWWDVYVYVYIYIHILLYFVEKTYFLFLTEYNYLFYLFLHNNIQLFIF